MKDTRIVDIDLVEPNPYQPRLEFDDEALMDLAQSIREKRADSANHGSRDGWKISDYCR